jgi:hypothetical protein
LGGDSVTVDLLMCYRGCATEYTQSGVHPIMMEKSALAGEGSVTILPSLKLQCTLPARRVDTLPLFILYPMYTLWGALHTVHATV